MSAHTARFGATIALSVLFAASASAIPGMQLYIDGATYDSTTETWTTTESEFDIWVIGASHKLPITDITLTAAYETGEAGTISLTPTTTSVVTDPSTPIAPVQTAGGGDGAIPTFGDGSSVPPHGTFGPGMSFLEWELGDMTVADSPCGDFIGMFPTTLNKTCQINVYSVEVTGFTVVHFDAFGMIGNKPIKAPFSHDADLVVPEPSAALLFGIGALVVSNRVRRR